MVLLSESVLACSSMADHYGLILERSVRMRLEEKIGQLNAQVKQSETLALVQEIREVPIPTEFQVGRNQYQQIFKSLSEFERRAKTSLSEVVTLANQFVADAGKELQSWKSSEQDIYISPAGHASGPRY